MRITEIVIAILLAGAAVEAATPQERAERLNKVLRDNLKVQHGPYLQAYDYSEKTWYLKRLHDKDAKLIDDDVRAKCLKISFIGAVHEHDAPFAACVLMRIRREVNGFSQRAEAALIKRAVSTARFASDYGRRLFSDALDEEIGRLSSPSGYTFARMRAIRIKPFILRPPATLADAVRCLNSKAVAADYVNDGMGVEFTLELESAEQKPPILPKVEVGCRVEGGMVESNEVTLEEAAKAVVESVGYALNIGSNGVVTVARDLKRVK